MGRTQKFEELEVWQKAYRFVLDVYNITKAFPREEQFALVNQMRRAAVSIPANIAEGYKKRSLRDKANFYNIAQGSLEESRYYLILAKDLGYLPQNGELLNSLDHVGKMLFGLLTSVSK